MERLVTTSEAAEILGLSLQGVHYRIKKEQLKSIKKDGKIFVYIDDSQSNIKINTNTQKLSQVSQNHFNQQFYQEQKQEQENSFKAIVDVKDEQIDLLKKSIKWMKNQYIQEIERLEKNQKKIIEVFNSEIKLLQSAFNEMRAIYKPQIEQKQEFKHEVKEETKSDFITIKEFFVIMKRANKSEAEIKNTIFKAIKSGDKRFIYNKLDKKLLILNKDYRDLL